MGARFAVATTLQKVNDLLTLIGEQTCRPILFDPRLITICAIYLKNKFYHVTIRLFYHIRIFVFLYRCGVSCCVDRPVVVLTDLLLLC